MASCVAPAGRLLATGPHTDPGCSAATYEIDCDLAQDSQIASCRSIPDAAVILVNAERRFPETAG
jgi:hypothetical protein